MRWCQSFWSDAPDGDVGVAVLHRDVGIGRENPADQRPRSPRAALQRAMPHDVVAAPGEELDTPSARRARDPGHPLRPRPASTTPTTRPVELPVTTAPGRCPGAATTMPPDPVAAASGSELTTPPRNCHVPHVDPLRVRCQSALSVPRTKTSMRPLPVFTTVGPDRRTPPSDVHAEKFVAIVRRTGPRARCRSRARRPQSGRRRCPPRRDPT